VTPNHKQIDALSLDKIKSAIVSQLGPDAVEVSIAGDAPMDFLETLAFNYLGTVPPRPVLRPAPKEQESLEVKTLGKGKVLGVYLPDSDERAMGYLAGPCPNKWGINADGSTVADMLRASGAKKDERRSHPLFGHVLLLVMQEVR
jgi:hypothetical protein